VPDQNGSTSLLLQRPIDLVCTKSIKHCACATNSTQNDFIARTPAKAAASRASPNTLRCASTLTLWHYYLLFHLILVQQIGTIIPTSTPFGGQSADNLPRSARKRTLVDELVEDAEARHYAKRKFNELQSARAAKGRGTLAARKAARKPKW